MKFTFKKSVCGLAVVILSVFNLNAQGNSPVAYMDKIGMEFKKVMDDMWAYTRSAAHGKKARTVESKRKELVNQLTMSINKVSKMKDYEGNTAYRDSVVSFLKLNKIILNEDYAKIVDMEEVAEQSYDQMEAYLLVKKKADERMEAASEMIDVEEKKFAKQFNINLIEGNDKIAKNLKVAGEVYDYYNEIYLLFFRCYKQELFMIDAMSKGDFNAMEQNRNALTQYCDENLKKLESVKPFKGDVSVKNACKEMLKFYQTETGPKFKDITDFMIEKEKFEKIKASFEAKKERDRTKDDVDQYNAAANSMNNLLNKYNKTNTEFNNNRSKLLDKWNNTVENFTDRNVPK